MPALSVEIVPCLTDNYAYLIADREAGTAAVVDPAEAEPVAEALERRGLKLTHILATHHHSDHTGGVLGLKDRFGARIVGPAREAARIPGLDLAVSEAQGFALFGRRVAVLETPGHTSGSVCYGIEDLLFAGDTLFVMGCGRLFEGDAATMHASLAKIAALSDDTLVYCGHEYALADARFALALEPENADVRAYAEEIAALRENGRPAMPAVLGIEKRANPFLRTHDPALKAALNMANAPAAAVLAEVRRRKDAFVGP